MNLFMQEDAAAVEAPADPALCQWFTPEWAAVELVDRFFPSLSASDFVLEPSCGRGAFLKAIPDNVPAVGVEIDEALAQLCRENTGRNIICGDFRTCDLPEGITRIIGNPPFVASLISQFLTRSYRLLPDLGQCGFILPTYTMQTAGTVMRWLHRWSLRVELLPRNIFPKSRLPLAFALLTRTRAERVVMGMALYAECSDVAAMNGRARDILRNGRPRNGVWRALVEDVLTEFGGRATLAQIYDAVAPRRPTANAWWKEKIRQTLQRGFRNCGPGEWEMAG